MRGGGAVCWINAPLLLSHSSWTADWRFPVERWRTGILWRVPNSHTCISRYAHANAHTPEELTWPYTESWYSASSCCQQPIITVFSWKALDSPSIYSSPVQNVSARAHAGVNVCLQCGNMSENKVLARRDVHTEKHNSKGCLNAACFAPITLCLLIGSTFNWLHSITCQQLPWLQLHFMHSHGGSWIGNTCAREGQRITNVLPGRYGTKIPRLSLRHVEYTGSS